jgi:hypothetical protein
MGGKPKDALDNLLSEDCFDQLCRNKEKETDGCPRAQLLNDFAVGFFRNCFHG